MVRFVSGSELLVPERSHVVHIGPSKTGTTSLQSAFHTCRDQMADQGVHVVGAQRHPWVGVRAFLGMESTRHGDAPPAIENWNVLVEEARSIRDQRTVISSEFLAHAKGADIRKLVEQFDADRVQIVVTLRPLAKILPSLWQQRVQAGVTRTLDEWLEDAFANTDGSSALWWRHRHDKLTARWVKQVGADRVTAVVVDDSDHGSVLRSFEHILGLKNGTLAANSSLSNRSLTYGEAEAIRNINVALQDTDMSRAARARIVGRGASGFLKDRKPDSSEAKVLMPQWAIDRAAEVSNTIIDGILKQEIAVTGDLDLLRKLPVSREESGTPSKATVPADVAARLAMGVVFAGGLAVPADGTPAPVGGKKKKKKTSPAVPVERPATAGKQPTLLDRAARRLKPSGRRKPQKTDNKG
ncbi:hypothetical protein SAMN06309944_2223 [Micrococcales bacterium KH10]|nr:hypothetical protein SAMN06309944_2223 [Micrococcales bacterium KH10]